jgi:hypothetical protein
VSDATDRDAPALSAADPIYPDAVQRLLPSGSRRAAAVLEEDRVVGVLYAPHVAAALRRATDGLNTSGVRR